MVIKRVTGIGYIIDSVNGYSLINGDYLTRKECDARVIEGTVTLGFNLIPGGVAYGRGVGLTEALMVSVKTFEYNAVWMSAPEVGNAIDVPELGFVIHLFMSTAVLYEAGKVDYVTERGVAKVSEEVDDVGREIEGVIKKDFSNEGYCSGAEWEELLAEKYSLENVVWETKTIEFCSEGGSVSVNPNEIRFSQSSVNGSEEIIASMKKNGWNGSPIDIVEMPDGVYTTIDNTRVVSVRQAGINVEADIHSYNEVLPSEYIERFTTKKGVPTTWGEAIEL